MNTPTVLSDCSSRHRHRKKSSSKRIHSLHSDHYEDTCVSDARDVISPSSSQTHIPGGRAPRMAELETLEAKMANIEVSLSTTPRRRKSGSLGGRPREAPKENQIKDKENVMQSIKDQLCTTANMNRMSQRFKEGGNGLPLTEAERQAAEERSTSLHQDVEAKRLSIKNLKLSLDRLDITDNIDIRIQQAELEYQLGREELELLTLLEQSRALQLFLEQDDHAKTKQDQQTIFSCIKNIELATLHAVQVEYDAKSPQFGAGPRPRGQGLWVEWTLDHTGMCKGDRLLEVNGKLVLTKAKEDMLRLLSISPSPAQIVVIRYNLSSNLCAGDKMANPLNGDSSLSQVGSLRAELDILREQAEETKRTKEGLRSDNLRLTHRISYLEEQVADLLGRNRNHKSEDNHIMPQKVLTSTVKTQRNVTNISITSDPTPKSSQTSHDIHVFQKGPEVTAIVSNIPGLELGTKDVVELNHNVPVIRPKSNLSNVSSTHIEMARMEKPNAQKTNGDHIEQSTKKLKLYSHLQSNHVHYNHKNSNGRYSLQPSRSSDVIPHSEDDVDLSKDKRQYALRQSMSYHSIYNNRDVRNFDYNSETSAALEIIKNNQRHYMEANYKNIKDKKSKLHSDDNSDTSKSSRRKSNKYPYPETIVQTTKMLSNSKEPDDCEKSVSVNQTKHNETKSVQSNQQFSFNDKWPHYHGPPNNDEYVDFHPERDYIDHRIDGKVIQNAHKLNRRLSKIQIRNTKSSDCDSEPVKVSNGDRYKSSRSKVIDYTSEPNCISSGFSKKGSQYLDRPRPLPPKKPVRLSLHRAQSMQTIEPDLNHNEKFYLHQPSERSKSSQNTDELRYSLTKNIIDDMVGYNKENRIKENSLHMNSESVNYNRKLKHQSKNFSKSEELIEYHISLSDKEHNHLPTENKRIKKRSHETRSSGNNEESYGGIKNLEYNHSRSESMSSNHIHPTRSESSGSNKYISKSSLNEYHREDNMTNSNEKCEYPKSKIMNGTTAHDSVDINKTSNPIVSSFKWTHPTIFKNIRIDGSSKANGNVNYGKK